MGGRIPASEPRRNLSADLRFDLNGLAIEIKETLGSSAHKLVQAAPLGADKGIRASPVRMHESHG